MRYQQILDISDAIKTKDYSKLYDTIAAPDFDINQVGRCDWTPLFVAADLGDKKIVETFLKMGANPNCVLSANEHPSVLAWTIKKASKEQDNQKRKQYTQIVDLLLQHGAREIPDHGQQTALHIAAQHGSEEIVDLLIKFGFNPWLKNRCGQSPIDYAIAKGHHHLAEKMRSSSSEDISISSIIKAGVIENFLYQRYDHVLNNQMSRRFGLPKEVTEKIQYFLFYRRGKIEPFNSDKGIMPAVKKDIDSLRSAFREGYVMNDHTVCALERAAKDDNHSMAKLLIRFGSILTEGAYKNAKTQEMRDLLLNAKQTQLEILKTELKLEEKDPRICTLS